MKHLKKLASFLLAMVMVLGLATTAFAAETTEKGSITIENAVDGQTYTIYRIFDLESYSTTNKAYSYKVNSAWNGFFATGAEGLNYVTIDGQGYVTWKENASAPDFATKALAYAKENKISNQGSAVKQKDTALKFENLDLGYYLVDSSLGALCSLNTTTPDVTIKEKNSEPTTIKEVKEGDTWGEKSDASIGDTVEFKATIHAKKGAENYVFHDVMDDGLTFNANSVVVTVKNTTLTAGTDYELVTNTTDDCTFHVVFKQTYLDTITDNTDIVITYSAVLNENADIVGGETNKEWVGYGDNNKTEEDSTNTKTWKFDVEKFTYVMTKGEDGAETQTEQTLAGATFTLSKNANGTDPIQFIRLKDADGKDTNTYRVAKANEAGAVTEITTDASGKFTLQGLDSGVYYLTETKAPAGYNKLPAAIKVTITNEGKVKKDNDAEAQANNLIKVENKSGTELPSTGGMGTTIFYVVGAILMLGAAVILITKRRMSAR